MAKVKYSMQNILDIKLKLEAQARNEFSIANQRYQVEKDKLQELVLKRVEYETILKDSLSGSLNVSEIMITKNGIATIKSAIRSQLSNVKKAEDELEIKRNALSELVKDRKTHEKLKEKAFEEFQKELKDSESKEIDEVVSFTYNS